jgi:type IV secretory pathway protease TraF
MLNKVAVDGETVAVKARQIDHVGFPFNLSSARRARSLERDEQEVMKKDSGNASSRRVMRR